MYVLPGFQSGNNKNDLKDNCWFPVFNFDPAVFKNPPRSFGPFTRWWWPGNDVTSEELQREIQLFAEHGFAGVEIQPLTMGINPLAPKEQLDKVYSWDSPSFYVHLKAVMEQAKVSGITVDLNGGSGWPVGGLHVKPEESMLTLTYADTVVKGGEKISVSVPKRLPDYAKIIIFDTLHLYKPVNQDLATLQSIITARVLRKEDGQFFLDASTVTNIAASVKNNHLDYTVPPGGDWVIIACWSVPDGQIPTLIAGRDPGFVANHFDSAKIFASYQHLFGERSGLQQYYGNPMRAVFNDSYEFRSDRHYSNDFIGFFKQQRGYDIIPWLCVNLEKGYNNNAAALIFPGAKPPFVFSDEDWRIRYDYDLTVGELLQQHFIKASNHWMQDRGMLHRTQAYGIKIDVIASSGSANIPEAEQLFAKGSEGMIKLVTSGAHLHNRPVVTQESYVFLGRSEMTTPQKIRALSDKAFTAGINQLIYSGTSYKYHTSDYPEEGWSTWSTPYSGFDFSSNINESYTWWNDIKKVNQYLTRSQYVLRSGKPQTDVLIYFPFADFTQEDLMENPEEKFADGYFEGVEPGHQAMQKQNMRTKEKWFLQVWKTINELNAKGITWEWVNDASLQAATAEHGSLNIRGNLYKAVVIADAPYIQLKTASGIAALAKQSVKFLVIGKAPEIQPGFHNYAANDAAVKQLIQESLQQANSRQILNATELGKWIEAIPQIIMFHDSCRFARTIDREMNDGSLVKFIWNQTAQWQTVSLNVEKNLPHLYWLDPADGTIVQAENKANNISTVLPPYGSVILYATHRAVNAKYVQVQKKYSYHTKEIVQITNWEIKAGGAVLANTNLFDWRNNAQFKYQKAPGVYTASFNMHKVNGKNYILDLGKVYFTAEVKINQQTAGKLLWSPYELDITHLIKNGSNTIEVTVIPSPRNAFIKEAANGNKHYQQFKGMENTILPSGLSGPVRILAD